MKTFREFLLEEGSREPGSRAHFTYHLRKALEHSLAHDVSDEPNPNSAAKRDEHVAELQKHYTSPKQHDTVLDHFYDHDGPRSASALTDIHKLYNDHYKK
jgi:hypothetical protein